jgi:hypothetical protein
VLTGRQTAEQARHAAATMTAFLHREQARLDIACPNR